MLIISLGMPSARVDNIIHQECRLTRAALGGRAFVPNGKLFCWRGRTIGFLYRRADRCVKGPQHQPRAIHAEVKSELHGLHRVPRIAIEVLISAVNRGGIYVTRSCSLTKFAWIIRGR